MFSEDQIGEFQEAFLLYDQRGDAHDVFQSSYLLTRAHFKVMSLFIQECTLLGKWFLCGWGFSQQLSSIICTGVLSFMFRSLRKSIQENIQKNIQNLFKIWAKSIQTFSVKPVFTKKSHTCIHSRALLTRVSFSKIWE